jgi:hypothetical protein
MFNKSNRILAIAAFCICTLIVATWAISDDQTPRTGYNPGNSDYYSLASQGLSMSPVTLNYNTGIWPQVGYGSYIVNTQSSCSSCHTVQDRDQYGRTYYSPQRYMAGGVNYGQFRSRNLTPDRYGRPGGYDLDSFRRAMRHGFDYDNGSHGGYDDYAPFYDNDEWAHNNNQEIFYYYGTYSCQYRVYDHDGGGCRCFTWSFGEEKWADCPDYADNGHDGDEGHHDGDNDGQHDGHNGNGGNDGQHNGQGGNGGNDGQHNGQGGNGGNDGQHNGQGGNGGNNGQHNGQGGNGGQGQNGGDNGQHNGQGGNGGQHQRSSPSIVKSSLTASSESVSTTLDMPWESYQNMSDDDLAAVYYFLQAIPSIDDNNDYSNSGIPE